MTLRAAICGYVNVNVVKLQPIYRQKAQHLNCESLQQNQFSVKGKVNPCKSFSTGELALLTNSEPPSQC